MPRGLEGAQKRPFRKLKIAAGIIAASAWVGLVGLCGVCDHNLQKEKKERARLEACWYTQDSLKEVAYRKDWKPIWGHGGGKAPASEIRSQCINRKSLELEGYRKMPRYCRPLWRAVEGTQVISDVIDEYQWHERRGGNPENTCQIPPAIRKEDSLYVVEGIREHDDAILAWEAGWSIKANQGMGAGRRDSLISATLDKFRPMLSAARERRQDSVLLRSLAAAARWALMAIKANPNMDAGNRDSLISTTLDKFRPMLPKAREREQDSVLVRAAISAGEQYERHLVDLRNANKIAELQRRRDCNSKKLEAIVAKTLDGEENARSWKEMVRHALRRYEKVKAPDGRSRERDSIAIAETLKWHCMLDVDCYKRWLEPPELLSEESFRRKWGNVSGIPRF